MPTQVVWFKRDLRVADHRPLVEAASRGPCLCLYVYEPDVLAGEDVDPCHVAFVNDSLAELRDDLRRRGGDLVLRHGRLPEVLAELHREHPFEAIWAHEETGNDLTFRRDRRVQRWCREQGVALHEFPQNGVIRRLKTRDGWAASWQARMSAPLLPAPSHVTRVAGVDSCHILTPETLGLGASAKTQAHRGGEAAAHATLESFLQARGMQYRRDMSSPNSAWDGCSRLSPYLAYGNLSLRQAYQATRRRAASLARETPRTQDEFARHWLASLRAFESRLSWHCHFMQKLEDEPAIEFANMNRAFDGLREDQFNERYFAAWQQGQTGYPLVDACMRALHATGWINFRMRAMLVSFAAYHLWLHWRRPALHLARQFLDYEPGIHYSQFQMQSGVTGINTVRIYSPVKQVRDQDADGIFIRQWVPELEGVPEAYLPEPHKMPRLLQEGVGCRVGRDYPPPIVPHGPAYAEARRRMAAARRSGAVRSEAQRVFDRHGSRKRPGRRPYR